MPADLKAECEREYGRLCLVAEQIRGLEAEQVKRLEGSDRPELKQVLALARLRGLGSGSAWVLVMEFFGWRGFRNRREVGAAAGLVGTPYASGQSTREQGISEAGNGRVRRLMVELGWLWLRYQPDSALSPQSIVSRALWGPWEAFPAHWDGGLGAAAIDCAAALSRVWGSARRGRAQAGVRRTKFAETQDGVG